MSRPKVFISAVTGQLKACRDAVASDLRAKGYEVKVQEDFQQGPRTLIEQIEQYIDACGLVVAIIGDAYGAEAAPAAVPKVEPPRSYTQWEYFFATGERLNGKRAAKKNLLVYFATEQYRREHAVAQTPEHTDRQRAFVDAIPRSGKHWGEFDSVDRLGRLLLRDLEPRLAFPEPPADPQALAAFDQLRAALARGDLCSCRRGAGRRVAPLAARPRGVPSRPDRRLVAIALRVG